MIAECNVVELNYEHSKNSLLILNKKWRHSNFNLKIGHEIDVVTFIVKHISTIQPYN